MGDGARRGGQAAVVASKFDLGLGICREKSQRAERRSYLAWDDMHEPSPPNPAFAKGSLGTGPASRFFVEGGASDFDLTLCVTPRHIVRDDSSNEVLVAEKMQHGSRNSTFYYGDSSFWYVRILPKHRLVHPVVKLAL